MQGEFELNLQPFVTYYRDAAEGQMASFETPVS